MTFCEMYKHDCPGCPNRYVCKNSTVTNPKCCHGYRHPCEECAHYYFSDEYDRDICHNESNAMAQHIDPPRMSPQERTRAAVYATGNRWAIENFNATH